MSPTSSIARLEHYRRKHGLGATLRRIGLALQRAVSLDQMAVYSCGLPVANAPAPLGIVERKKIQSALSIQDAERILTHWNSEAMRRLMDERFAAGADLWLLRWNGSLAAYGWTLKGKTLTPHYFPICPEDVHLFDFFVFEEFRGRGLNPSLVWQILVQVGGEDSRRALIEAAAWNHAQLSSLAKTPFRKIGLARKFRMGKSSLILWSNPRKT